MPIAAAPQGGFLIFLTFITAFVLTIFPLPNWLNLLRPEWVAMTVIYWCIALPDRVGVIYAWIVGLLLDVLVGAVLGQHALALASVAYLSLRLHLRIRLFPLWQMALSVMLLVTLHQLITLWIKGYHGQGAQNWAYWLPSVSSMVLWPVVYSSLRFVRRTYRIR